MKQISPPRSAGFVEGTARRTSLNRDGNLEPGRGGYFAVSGVEGHAGYVGRRLGHQTAMMATRVVEERTRIQAWPDCNSFSTDWTRMGQQIPRDPLAKCLLGMMVEPAPVQSGQLIHFPTPAWYAGRSCGGFPDESH